MNINVYIEDSLAKSLNQLTKELHLSRNAIIREALKKWIIQHQVTRWPKSIATFKGVSDFPAFESYRTDLLDSDEDPFK